jgi:hypothetical protein
VVVTVVVPPPGHVGQKVGEVTIDVMVVVEAGGVGGHSVGPPPGGQVIGGGGIGQPVGPPGPDGQLVPVLEEVNKRPRRETQASYVTVIVLAGGTGGQFVGPQLPGVVIVTGEHVPPPGELGQEGQFVGPQLPGVVTVTGEHVPPPGELGHEEGGGNGGHSDVRVIVVGGVAGGGVGHAEVGGHSPGIL